MNQQENGATTTETNRRSLGDLGDSAMASSTDRTSGEAASNLTANGDGSVDRHQVEQPSIAVLEAVATATNRDPIDLPRLHDYVDPDALDALVSAESADGSVSVSFDYDGLEVTVDAVDSIELRSPTRDGD